VITPVPTRSPIIGDTPERLIDYVWAQWFTGLVKGVNATPGNSAAVPFAQLPQPTVGQIAVITDSAVNTWGSVITGGGGFTVAGLWNGTHWTVLAK
jgi:hypothetical protein